ncbi:hypothetical protein WN51_05028 [Melipona quadrifasciata]|uniref:Uncharacterized protein n=1 Tax=Melipona quadrifasciata TaxID=166423 RepID=A0A0M8ZU99_9HYME|nr:hypothetical protein WN51_05028 [Melipona quadrifasciata]
MINAILGINRAACRFLVTAVMICGGLVMYPIGWDNREVRESCGKGANVYNLVNIIEHDEERLHNIILPGSEMKQGKLARRYYRKHAILNSFSKKTTVSDLDEYFLSSEFKKKTNCGIRFGHSLWSVSQLLVQEVLPLATGDNYAIVRGIITRQIRDFYSYFAHRVGNSENLQPDPPMNPTNRNNFCPVIYRRVKKEDELLYTVWSLVMVREPVTSARGPTLMQRKLAIGWFGSLVVKLSVAFLSYKGNYAMKMAEKRGSDDGSVDVMKQIQKN